MTITHVRIPGSLRDKLTPGKVAISVEGETAREVLDGIDALHPGFKGYIVGDDGKLKRWAHVYIGDDDIRFLNGLETPAVDGASMTLIPSH